MTDLPEINEFPQRVTRKVFQQLLLSGRTFWYGRIGEWKGRHLGAGIYEVKWVADAGAAQSENTTRESK